MITLEDLEICSKPQLSFSGSDFFFPNYRGYGLANVPSSICRWLNVPLLGENALAREYPFSTESFDRVILLVMDGLGWQRLMDCLKTSPDEFGIWKKMLEQEQLTPLTSVVPSTTCAVLSTLNTAKTPAEHGNLAYELWLKEYGMVANMILHAPMTFRGEAGSLKRSGFKPEEFLSCLTLDAHLISHGVTVEALHPYPISQSSLTAMLLPEAHLRGYHSLSDLWYRVKDFLERKMDSPAYLYAYWSEVDELSHLYSPGDIRVSQAFRDFTRYLSDLVETHQSGRSPRTLLVLTADHGLKSTPCNSSFSIQQYGELMDCLTICPTGENRLPFLHVRPGKEDHIERLLEKYWPGKFEIRKSVDVLASGLLGLGQISEQTGSRLGDLMIFPRDDAYWWWAPKENRLLGRHGGLSRDEMIVPIGMLKV